MVTKHRQLENLIFLTKGEDVIKKQIEQYIKELEVEIRELQKRGFMGVKIETKLNVSLSRQEQMLVEDMEKRK